MWIKGFCQGVRKGYDWFLFMASLRLELKMNSG